MSVASSRYGDIDVVAFALWRLWLRMASSLNELPLPVSSMRVANLVNDTMMQQSEEESRAAVSRVLKADS